MTEFAHRVGAQPPEGEPDAGFAVRIASSVSEEARRLLEEAAAVRRDALEVTRVARAIGLEVPAELEALAALPEITVPERRAPAVAPAPAPVARSEPEPGTAGTGTSSRSSRAAEINRGAILRFLTEQGPQPLTEIVAAMRLGQPTVSRHLKALREAGQVTKTKVADYRYPVYRALVPEDFPNVDPAALAAVRDFVCSARRPFAPADVIEATGLDEQVVRDAFRVLIERTVIKYVGFDDLELYEYERPTDPGPGNARRADADAASNGHARGGAVPGTGNGKISGNAGVRKLVSECERLGATVARSAGGHIAITYRGRRTMIASTPRSEQELKGARSRLRQAGLAL